MRLLVEHPHIAGIDCADCSRFAYDLQTGERRLHGGQPIPVRHPPCADDETVCPKVRPGHSDLTEANMRLFADYLYCRSIDRWPDDDHSRRYRLIIDSVYAEAEIARQRREQMQELRAVLRSVRKGQ